MAWLDSVSEAFVLLIVELDYKILLEMIGLKKYFLALKLLKFMRSRMMESVATDWVQKFIVLYVDHRDKKMQVVAFK